jgi:hypothetical protein
MEHLDQNRGNAQTPRPLLGTTSLVSSDNNNANATMSKDLFHSTSYSENHDDKMYTVDIRESL